MARKPARRTITLPALGRSRDEERKLRDILRRALQQALAPGLALGLLACGAQPIEITDAAGQDVGARDADVAETSPADSLRMPIDAQTPCELARCEGGRWNPVAGLSPAEPIDYVAFVRCGEQGFAGQACQTATDQPSCLKALADAKNQAGGGGRGQGCQTALIVTKGDRVATLSTEKDLRAFLGRIDSPQEALLLVTFLGYEVGCNNPSVAEARCVSGGFEVKATRTDLCPYVHAAFVLFVGHDGQVKVMSRTVLAQGGCMVVGRRPEGLRFSPDKAAPWTLGSFLADSAHLEAASVPAFHVLARDLQRLGAPKRLVCSARRAARDEVRHTRLMTRLATQYGAAVEEPTVERSPPKRLTALALENAVEGCVRETFGAAVAGYQARMASDPAIGAAMAAIVEDETRHALLAWRIASWAEPRLDSDTRREIALARKEAVNALRAQLGVVHAPDVHATAGWPSPQRAAALLDALDATLWHTRAT